MQDQTNDIKAVAVKRALVLLRSANVEFAIIVNGTKIGDLEIAEKKTKREPRLSYMTLYPYMEQLQALKEGQSVKIPVAYEHRFGLQGSICSAMGKMYGAGSYMTTTSDKYVEVLRFVSEEMTAA